MIRRAWLSLTRRVAAHCTRICLRRPPDFVVGGMADPYLLRWYLTPWRHWFLDPSTGKTRKGLTGWRRWAAAVTSRLPNLYLHLFLRPDDDRALHDHPWAWVSWLLSGTYVEHTIAAGGIRCQRRRWPGSVRCAFAKTAHRVDLIPEPKYAANLRAGCLTLWPTRLWASLRAYEATWDTAGRPPGYRLAFSPAMTLFLTGFRTRGWGFHCPDAGWVPWEDFTDPATAGSTVGRGCDQ